jgi:hypothetical protein
MGAFDAIQYVGGGLSLVAFVVAAVLSAYRARLHQQAEIIKSAPERDRLEAIATAAEFFRVDVSTLSSEQQEKIVLTEIETRARRDRLLILIAAAVAVLLAIVAIVAILTEAAPGPAANNDTWTQEVGGPGGSPFGPLSCRSGEALVGLFGKDKDTRSGSGPYIFSIGPICAPARLRWISKSISLGPKSRGDEVGSDYGVPFELTCPDNMVVVGSELESSSITVTDPLGKTLVITSLIDHLTLRCSGVLRIDNPSSVKTVSTPGTPIPSFKTRTPLQCPDGSAAIGIRGRTGQWIDQLGIGCRRL